MKKLLIKIQQTLQTLFSPSVIGRIEPPLMRQINAEPVSKEKPPDSPTSAEVRTAKRRSKKKAAVEKRAMMAQFVKDHCIEVSPFQQQINAVLKAMYADAQGQKNPDTFASISNALYCAAAKRMRKRLYQGDNKAYLVGLISDLAEGKVEFSQVCYECVYASAVFAQLKATLIQLYSEQ